MKEWEVAVQTKIQKGTSTTKYKKLEKLLGDKLKQKKIKLSKKDIDYIN